MVALCPFFLQGSDASSEASHLTSFSHCGRLVRVSTYHHHNCLTWLMLNQGASSTWSRYDLNLALVWDSILSQKFLIVDNVVSLVVSNHWTCMISGWVWRLSLWACCWHDFCWLVGLLQTLWSYRFDVEIYIILEGIYIWSIPLYSLLRHWLVLGVWVCRRIFSFHESLTCVFDEMIKCAKWFDFNVEVSYCCLRSSARARYDDPWPITYIWILILLIARGGDSITWVMLFHKSWKSIKYSDPLICHLLWHLLSDTNRVVLFGSSRSLS